MATFDSIQLSLFGNDMRPLPLLTAERWGFQFAHVDPTGNPIDYLYCARDWYMGLGGDKGRWSKSKSDWLSASQPVEIEVKRQRRKPEMLEFVNAEGLYKIAARMQSKGKRPQLEAIKDYLAKAGVKFDEIRTSPEKAAEFIDAVSRHHKQRLEGIVSRNDLMDWLREQFGKEFAFGIFTNREYVGLFGRKAGEISAQSGKKNARDGMTTEGLAFVTIVESSCLRLFKGRESVSEGEAFEIVRAVAEPLGANVQMLQQQLGIDIATGRSLIDA